MHLPEAKQLRDKTMALHKALGDLVAGPAGKVVRPIVKGAGNLGYRWSTKVCLQEDSFGRRSIGLYEFQSRRVVNIPDCPVHHPEVNRIVQDLLDREPPAPFYDHAKRGFQSGRLKFLTIRWSVSHNQAGIIVSHTGVDKPALKEWLGGYAQSGHSIYECLLSPQDAGWVLSDRVRHLAGPATIEATISGQVFRLHPASFFQANHYLASDFVEEVCRGSSGNLLLDLYGGFGAYAFRLAGNFERILLVDGSPHAIRSARDNLRQLPVPERVRPVQKGCEDFLATGLSRRELTDLTHVIVNPPRAGLSPAVRKWLASPPPGLRKITYASCDPVTLARDLRALTSKSGFRLDSITPFDMFPHTEHLETVAHLVR